MARASKAKTKKRAAPAKAKAGAIDEKALSKGQLRKLGALRKSLGDDIADKAFAEWMKTGGGSSDQQVDKNAQLIAETLGELVNSGKLRIPRGGYVLTRGRGRVIVQGAG